MVDIFKPLKPDEIRKMSKEERRKLLEQLKFELMKLRAKAEQGTLEKPHLIRIVKRNIARILTIEKEEELGIRR